MVDAKELFQILSPEGILDTSNKLFSVIDILPEETLLQFYQDMVFVRRLDNEATILQRQGQIAMWPPCLGQEAAQVGSARAAKTQDFLVPSYREHGVAHVRGIDFVDIVKVFRGINHGGWNSFTQNFHIYTLVLGAQTLHATGYAMGLQRDKLVGTGDDNTDSAVMVYFGDGTTSEGDVHEAMTFAASNNSPIVFFCQNNQWAISVPTIVQSRVPLYKRAAGYGMPGIRVDGNDALAVYAVTAEALKLARSGGGPTFIEAYTYRMGAHTTADDPTKYRTLEEEKRWAVLDPISRFEAYLRKTCKISDTFFVETEVQANKLALRLREACLSLSEPKLETIFDYVYAQEHSLVVEEKEWFLKYQDSFEEPEIGGKI